jgi:hypothetical protein
MIVQGVVVAKSSPGCGLFSLDGQFLGMFGGLGCDCFRGFISRFCGGGNLDGGEGMGQFVQEKAIVGFADDGRGFGGEEGPDGAGEVEGLGVHVEADVLAQDYPG